MEKSMNKEILNKTEDLVATIEESNLYQEYLLLKEKLEKNDKAKMLIKEIKVKQKELVHKKYNKESFIELEMELENLERKLNQIPLYSEFIEKQNELNDIFYQIKTQIEICLDQN